MNKSLENFSRQRTILLYKWRKLFRSSKESVRCPPELLIMIALLVDSATLVRLTLCCRWLFQEISNWSNLWKEQYCRVFPFDKGYRELYWLQQFVERSRPLNPPVIPR